MSVCRSVRILGVSLVVWSAGLGVSHAGELLSGVGNTLGGLSNTTGNTISGVGGAVTGSTATSIGGALNSTTGSVASSLSTDIGASVLGDGAAANAQARSKALGGITAKLRLMDKRQLIKFCLSAGGGDGCRYSTTTGVRSIIQARLKVLSARKIASLCISIGGSCGGGQALASRDTRGQSRKLSSRDLKSREANGVDKAGTVVTCRKILRSPAGFEQSLVSFCRGLAMR